MHSENSGWHIGGNRKAKLANGPEYINIRLKNVELISSNKDFNRISHKEALITSSLLLTCISYEIPLKISRFFGRFLRL
jgi:hypothetical protein